jgi:hypothetical protein
MKRILPVVVFAAVAALALSLAGTALAEGAGGVSGPGFYVDGEQYRTVATPTDLSGTGAPAHSFDTIYAISGQPNVATAAPGDPGYNGGRWMVHAISFDDYDAAVAAYDTNGSGDFDSDEELDAALDAGAATDDGVIRYFECPVIPVPQAA